MTIDAFLTNHGVTQVGLSGAHLFELKDGFGVGLTGSTERRMHVGVVRGKHLRGVGLDAQADVAIPLVDGFQDGLAAGHVRMPVRAAQEDKHVRVARLLDGDGLMFADRAQVRLI